MTLCYIHGVSGDMSASSNLLFPCSTVNTKATGFSEHFSLPKKSRTMSYFTAITAVHRNMHVMTLCRQCSARLFCHSAKTVQAGRNTALKTTGYSWPARSSTLCEARPNRRPTVLTRVRVRRHVCWTVTSTVCVCLLPSVQSRTGTGFDREQSVEEDVWYWLGGRNIVQLGASWLYSLQTFEGIFKECQPRCVGELDRWEGSQKHNSCLI